MALNLSERTSTPTRPIWCARTAHGAAPQDFSLGGLRLAGAALHPPRVPQARGDRHRRRRRSLWQRRRSRDDHGLPARPAHQVPGVLDQAHEDRPLPRHSRSSGAASSSRTRAAPRRDRAEPARASAGRRLDSSFRRLRGWHIRLGVRATRRAGREDRSRARPSYTHVHVRFECWHTLRCVGSFGGHVMHTERRHFAQAPATRQKPVKCP